MKRKHFIAIVDDDADDRDIIRDAFDSAGGEWEYVLLETGDRLLQYLEETEGTTELSLILLDLNMPGKSGRETLKEIKTDQRFKHIPVIIFTTSSSQRDSRVTYELGANCFVTKPDTFNKLVELTSSISKLWLQLAG